MTDNAKRVLNFLKENYGKEDVTKQDIAAALEITVSAVTGSVNALVKNSRAAENIVEVPGEGEGAKATTKRYVMLTEIGMAFDPDAEEAKPKKAKKAKAEA